MVGQVAVFVGIVGHAIGERLDLDALARRGFSAILEALDVFVADEGDEQMSAGAQHPLDLGQRGDDAGSGSVVDDVIGDH